MAALHAPPAAKTFKRPASFTHDESGKGNGESPGDSRGPSTIPSKKRVALVAVACNACRRKKQKCDGGRPNCSNCARSMADCVYDAPEGQSRWDALKHQHDALKTERDNLRREVAALRLTQNQDRQIERESLRRENEALRRVLYDTSGSSEIESPKSSALVGRSTDRSPSFHATAASFLPNWLTNVEFELTLTHANAYPSIGLPDMATLWSIQMRKVRSILGEILFAEEPSTSPAGAETPNGRSAVSVERSIAQLPARRISAVSPTQYCDRRLDGVTLQRWTSVWLPDELGARMISFYLESDHPILGGFDPDLFVHDLVKYEFQFCSSMLVNTVLLQASFGYSAIDERAAMLKSAFATEVLHQWDKLQDDISILTASAGLLLSYACIHNGDDKRSQEILKRTQDIALCLGLFGISDGNVANDDLEAHVWLRARAYLAWGLFNWSIMRSFFYQNLLMEQPPNVVIPGDAHTWSLPKYMGNTFTRMCKLELIVNKVALLYFSKGSDTIRARMTLRFAESTYRELLAWADMNGPMLNSWENDAHHQSILHIHFHSAVLDIFRPLLGTGNHAQPSGGQRLGPEEIFHASLKQLRYQVLMYPAIHSPTMTTLWNLALMHVANAALTNLDIHSSQEMFLMCLLGYYDLSLSFPIMSMVNTGLVSIAARSRNIDKRTAQRLLRRLRRQMQGIGQPQPFEALCMVDLAGALQDSTAATADKLAERFDRVSLNGSPVG